MSNIYLSYNNIISSLGFDSDTVVANIENEVSGLHVVTDENPEYNYVSSLIDTVKLKEQFESLAPGKNDNYTRLEQMMLLSLSQVVKESNIELNNRVGLLISTTKGNIDALDTNVPFESSKSYLAALGKTIGDFFGFANEAIVVSNACISGILAVSIAHRYVKAGIYDHVFVVGGDVVTDFILSGFGSFQALSSEPCKPYDKNRNGINIGEVAASTLVTNSEDNLWEGSVVIKGGASCNDANHISGPSRTGEGLYRSIQSALNQAKMTANDIDYISSHGTATLYNDEMESIAFTRSGMQEIPVTSLKGYFGHTLGASGLLEAIVGVYALKHNVVHKTLGYTELGVTNPIAITNTTTNKEINTLLKTASGFGGCNCAVVFEKINL